MDSFTPAGEPPAPPNGNLVGAFAVAAFASALAVPFWRRTEVDGEFPVVHFQDTKRNQAICSLMSSVLLRKVGERKRHFGRRKRRRQVEETIQLAKGKEAGVNWRLPEGRSNQDNPLVSSIDIPLMLIVREERVMPTEQRHFTNICDAAAQNGWGAAEVTFQNDGSYRDGIRQVLRHVVSKLTPETPLFLVIGDETVIKSSLSSYNADCATQVSGLIIMVSTASCSGNAETCSFFTETDAPILLLNVGASNDSTKVPRSNPNVINVQLSCEKSASKDSWVARCVIDFADAVIRLPSSFRSTSNHPRARL